MSLIAPQDAAFLLGETAAQPTHVAGLAVYELPPGTDPDYVSRLYHELLTHTAIHPRLRQRPADPVGSLGNVWWTEEHHLDLEYNSCSGIQMAWPTKLLKPVATSSHAPR